MFYYFSSQALTYSLIHSENKYLLIRDGGSVNCFLQLLCIWHMRDSGPYVCIYACAICVHIYLFVWLRVHNFLEGRSYVLLIFVPTDLNRQ